MPVIILIIMYGIYVRYINIKCIKKNVNDGYLFVKRRLCQIKEMFNNLINR